MAEKSSKKQNILGGAMVLVIATALVKVIGAVYKIPLNNLMGTWAVSYYSTAYNIYVPVYAISMAGLPVAISAIVSKNVALGKYRDVKQVLKITFPLFLGLGVLGTGVLLLAAKPYVDIVHSSNALFSVIAIAPSIIFCCIMSTYRGYYEGLNNMYPTAISQVIESLGKLVFGAAFLFGIGKYAEYQIANDGLFFGEKITSTDDFSVCAMQAAGAILGVTLGTVIGALYTILRHKIKKDGITKEMLVNSPLASPKRSTLKDLVAIAIPTAMSSVVLNITNFIDNVMILNRLDDVVGKAESAIVSQYGIDIDTVTKAADEGLHVFLHGSYELTSSFRNLIPTIVMTLGVSAIPVISGALAKKDMKTVNGSVNTVFRITMLFALPAGAGFLALAEPILTILYGSGRSASGIPIATPILALYGLMMGILTLSSPLTNMVQAIGRADAPAKALALGCVFKIGLNYILIGIPEINVMGAVFGTAAFYLICIIYNFIVLRKETKVKIDIKSVLIKPFISSVVCGGAAFGSFKLLSHFLTFRPDSMLSGRNISCLAAIGIAVLAYGICVLLTKTLVKDDILMLPKGEKIAKILEKYKLIG